MDEHEQAEQKRCPKCTGLKAATRDEFYEDKRTKTGLSSWCKACEIERAAAAQRSAKGRLTRRRRQVLLKRAGEALLSGELGQVFPCELVDGRCGGAIEAHFPDETEPEEYLWLCEHHRQLINGLRVAPSYEGLVQLAEDRGA